VTGDSHKNAEVRRGLQPIVDMANRVGAAVLGITHFTKGSKGADPTERVTGSLAFGALARLVMCTAKPTDSEDRRRLVRSKSNIGPDGGGFEYELKRIMVAKGVEGQAVQWCDAIDGNAHELLADVESDDGGCASDRADAERWLLEILEDAPLTKKSVESLAGKAGFSVRTVQRAARDCPYIEVKRTGFGKDLKSMWSSTKSPFAPTLKNGANMEDAGANGETVAIPQKPEGDKGIKPPFAPHNMSGANGQKQPENSQMNTAEKTAQKDPFGDDEGVLF